MSKTQFILVVAVTILSVMAVYDAVDSQAQWKAIAEQAKGLMALQDRAAEDAVLGEITEIDGERWIKIHYVGEKGDSPWFGIGWYPVTGDQLKDVLSYTDVTGFVLTAAAAEDILSREKLQAVIGDDYEITVSFLK